MGRRQLARCSSSTVSPGRRIVVLFWTKYAVPRQDKPGILEFTTSRGQRNLCTVFSFVSCEEKGCYRIVLLGHQNFDCRSYCGLSPRMQGYVSINLSEYGRHVARLRRRPGGVLPTIAVHSGSKVVSSSFSFDRRSVNISARVNTRGFSWVFEFLVFI